MKIFSATLKGTTTVSQGTTNLSGSFTGSYSGSVAGIAGDISDYSSSVALRATTLEAASGSFSTRTTNIERVYATTGSNTFTAAQIIQGTLTAQTLVVQTVTSSVLFSTGSNKIGSSLSNVQELTGSVGITGSLAVVTTGTEFQVNAGGVNIGNALTDNHIISGSVTINPNGLFVSSSGNVGIGTSSPSTKFQVYESLTNTSAYLTIQNNRARNAAVYTVTSNGGFYAGTSIGTDTFNYQIYDAVAGEARLTIASTGAATFQSVNAKTNTGNWHQTIYDTSTMAAGVGGGISFCGNKATSTLGLFAAIDGYKENATSANELGGFRIWTSNGTNLAERMRITSAGNVGVGIAPSTGWSSFTAIQLGGNTYSAVVSSNHYLNVAANSYYDGTNFKYIANGFSTRYQQSDGTHLWYAAASGTAGNTVSYSEAVRIETDGNLQINNAKGLKVFTEGNGAYWLIRSYNAASNQLRFNYQGSDLASIATGTGNYTALSDVNKKKDFEASQIGLNEVLGLKPTLYRMKTQGDTEDKQLGFIAQEVKEFIPQAYSETGEGDDKFIGLTEMPIIAALVKAVQQQQSQIEELKTLLKA